MNFDLIRKHICPRFIVDVGARFADWSKEAKAYWPECILWLVEGNLECEPQLKESGFNYEIALLSDKNASREFYTMRDCPAATGCSYYKEKTPMFNDAVTTKRETITLDSLINKRFFLDQMVWQPILLKLDAQGAELDILKGGIGFLTHCQAVLTEVSHKPYNEGAPLEPEVTSFLLDHGFKKVACVGETIIAEHNCHQSDYLYARI